MYLGYTLLLTYDFGANSKVEEEKKTRLEVFGFDTTANRKNY